MKASFFTKIILLLLVGWIALIAVGQARAEFEQYEPVAVQTTCLDSWDAPGVWGYTRIDQPGWPVYLSPYVCDALRIGPSSSDFPNAIAVLYHEWVHSWFQTTDEGAAECVSLFFLRYELRHVWGLSPGAAEKVYEAAWRTHVARYVLFPQYHGVCEFPQDDPVP